MFDKNCFLTHLKVREKKKHLACLIVGNISISNNSWSYTFYNSGMLDFFVTFDFCQSRQLIFFAVAMYLFHSIESVGSSFAHQTNRTETSGKKTKKKNKVYLLQLPIE